MAYERVSTARQGASGLGLEARRKVIDDFAVVIAVALGAIAVTLYALLDD